VAYLYQAINCFAMSKKTYASQISWSTLLLLIGLLGSCSAVMILSQAWLGLGILLLAALFIASFYVRTAYTITADGKLDILCGLVYRNKIDIKAIKSVRPSSNPMSSPALSLHGNSLQRKGFCADFSRSGTSVYCGFVLNKSGDCFALTT
jgi:Bacterial PH domain